MRLMFYNRCYKMNQSNPRVPSMPMRYSSRQKIFNNYPANENLRGNEQEEIFRLVAKIRSLEDDIRSLLNTNTEIQSDNKYLTKMMSQLEYSLQVQQTEISSLTERIQAQQKSAQTIEQYESTLAQVGQKVDMLNEIIWERNYRFDDLKKDRDRAMQQQMQLKQHNNRLLYEHNRSLTEIDQLIQLSGLQPVEQEELEERVERLILECRKWEQNLKGGEQNAQTLRKEREGLILAERQKQIKIEYSIKLLSERVRDSEQKKNYFAGCYNQESIQTVIDDMLKKEHLLRSQIQEQAEINTNLETQGREALISAQKRILRQRDSLLEQLKLQRMENELEERKKEVINSQLEKLTQNFEDQYANPMPSGELPEVDREPYPRIRQLQALNGELASELIRLQSQVQVLRKQMMI